MTLLDELRDEHVETSFRADVQTAHTAEMDGLPVQNGRQRDIDVSKNTHFEYTFGGGRVPEATLYIERFGEPSSVELMLWAHDAWFADAEVSEYGPELSDGGTELAELGQEAIKIVQDELNHENAPQFEWQQRAPPWNVFNTLFYLD